MIDNRTPIQPPDIPPDRPAARKTAPVQTPAPHSDPGTAGALPTRRDTPFEGHVPDPLADMGLAAPGEEKAPIPEPHTPAAPGTAPGGAWDWTEQYARKASMQKAGEDDSRGYDIGDPILSPEEAQMRAMYVPEERVKKTHNPNLTFTPRIIPKAFPWRWVFAAIVTLMIGCLVLAFTVPLDTGELDSRGNPISRTLFQSFLKNIDVVVPSGNPERTAYLETKERLRDVEAAALQYEQKSGGFPASVDALMESGFLPEASSRDGWGNRFVLYPVVHKIVSNGADGRLDTLDDISLDPKGFTIPQAYQEFELNKSGEGF